jgi:hypothetical protein
MIMSYRWSEEDVTQHLGITKRELKTLRKERLEPMEHFEIVEGKHRFSDTGLFALCAFVKVDPPAGMDPQKKTADAANGEAEPVELVVERMCPNPTWVLCRVDGVLEKCRVANNAYLHPRKKIKAVRTGDHWSMLRVRV